MAKKHKSAMKLVSVENYSMALSSALCAESALTTLIQRKNGSELVESRNIVRGFINQLKQKVPAWFELPIVPAAIIEDLKTKTDDELRRMSVAFGEMMFHHLGS